MTENNKAQDVDPRVRHITYACSHCGKATPRDDLSVKRVEFSAMGAGGKLMRRRTVGWYCGPCREADPAWNMPARAGAPGMANTKVHDAG